MDLSDENRRPLPRWPWVLVALLAAFVVLSDFGCLGARGGLGLLGGMS